MLQFSVIVHGERHAFGHLIADKIAALEPDRFCTFQVPNPLQNTVHIVVGASGEADAVRIVDAACSSIIADIDRTLHSLHLQESLPTSVALEVDLPDVRVERR